MTAIFFAGYRNRTSRRLYILSFAIFCFFFFRYTITHSQGKLGFIFHTKYHPAVVASQEPRNAAKRDEGIVEDSDDPNVEKRQNAEKAREEMFLQFFRSKTGLKTLKKEKRLPDVIGIGVEKCGSGPLHWMISHHPMIVTSSPTELHFFGTEKQKSGEEGYRSLMPEVASYELALEKTPAYFNFGGRNLPMAMKKIVPNAKILLVLCDPVNRTYSDFIQEKMIKAIARSDNFEMVIDKLLENLSALPQNNDSAAIHFLQKAMNHYKNHILSTGLYYYYLTTWFEAYNRNQIHIIDGEELLTDPGNVLEKVQEFLKIPKLIIKEDFVRDSSGFFCMNAPTPIFNGEEIILERPEHPECMQLHSKGRTRMGRWQYKPTNALLERLRNFFDPHNRKLYDLIDRKFDWQQPNS